MTRADLRDRIAQVDANDLPRLLELSIHMQMWPDAVISRLGHEILRMIGARLLSRRPLSPERAS